VDNRELSFVEREIEESRFVVEAAAHDPAFKNAIERIGAACTKALRVGGKIMFAGNGGSAADAQHLAGEMISRLNYDRAPLAAIALTVDTSVLTAVGNDYGYEQIFERQVRGVGRAGDVFVGISTSGRSPNILRALRAAREMGVVTVGFTGRKGGDMPPLCDFVLHAPSDRTPMIQQLHIMAGHIICGLIESHLFPIPAKGV